MAYQGLSRHVNLDKVPSPADRFALLDLIGEGTYGEVRFFFFQKITFFELTLSLEYREVQFYQISRYLLHLNTPSSSHFFKNIVPVGTYVFLYLSCGNKT